jgi:hypothetical protein
VEYDDIDFETRDHVSNASWPIKHEALKSFYPAARKFLTADVSEAADAEGDADFERSRESWARIPNSARANAQALKENALLKIVRDTTATQVRLNSETGKLSAVTVMGRNATRDIVAPYFVFAAGGRENTRLLLGLQRQKQAIFGGIGGALGRYYMGHLTGEIATIAFRSNLSASKFLFKQSATGVVVRERFLPAAKAQIDHQLLNVAMWPDSLRPDEVIPGNGALSLFHMARHLLRRAHDPIFRDRISAAEVSSAHFKNIAAHPMQTMFGSSRLLARKVLSSNQSSKFDFVSPTNTYLLRFHAEHSPYFDSRVTLSKETDPYGCPRLDVDFRYGANDTRSIVNAHRLLANWLTATGLGSLSFLKPDDQLEQWILDQALDGYHQIGLTRMSKNKHDGVVDENCATHDVKNLFIAGSSVFPTSGQANPTLPAVAMSLRLAAHLSGLLAASSLRQATTLSRS